MEFRKPILGDKQGNVRLRILHKINITCFKYFHKNRLITTSMDNKSDFVSGHASKPYRITGTHLLMISCKTTSSDCIS